MGMTIDNYITGMYIEQVLQRGSIVPWVAASFNLLIHYVPTAHRLLAHFHHIKSKQVVISQTPARIPKTWCPAWVDFATLLSPQFWAERDGSPLQHSTHVINKCNYQFIPRCKITLSHNFRNGYFSEYNDDETSLEMLTACNSELSTYTSPT